MSRRADAATVARTRAFWAANKPGETAAPAYAPEPPLWWHVALALAIALIVQSSLAPFIAFRGGTLPLVILVVFWYAIRTDSIHGLAFGLLTGAAEDALAGTTGVAWTFATAFVGLVAGRFARTWLADIAAFLVPAAAALVIVRYGFFAALMHLQGRAVALPLVQLHAIVWQAAFAGLAAFALPRLFPAIRGVRH